MKVVIIVQARMTSARLPGKVMMEVMDKPLIGYLLERLQRVTRAHEVVVATTTNSADQPIVDYCKANKVAVFRGGEHDVLARYHDAAKKFGAEIIVRITADCPLMDPSLVDALIERFQETEPHIDYLANVQERTFPRGMDAEVFTFQFLDEAFYKAEETYEREHVTPYMYHHPEIYRSATYTSGRPELGYMRLTVDEMDDFTLVSKVIRELYPVNSTFSLDDVINVLEAHPEWRKINANVQQKPTKSKVDQ